MSVNTRLLCNVYGNGYLLFFFACMANCTHTFLWLSANLSIYLYTSLSIFILACFLYINFLPTFASICSYVCFVWLFIDLHTCLLAYLSVCLFVCVCSCSSAQFSLSCYASLCLSLCLPGCPHVYLSVHLPGCVSCYHYVPVDVSLCYLNFLCSYFSLL